MKHLLLSTITCFCLSSVVSAQDLHDPSLVFAEHLKKDDTVLRTHPTIAKAHETWKTKLEAATATYQKGMESLLDREKSRGDLETVKSYERALDLAKTQHSLPCILFDRLPTPAATLLTNLNRAKSRENKIFVAVLDKEMTSTLRQKGAAEAKKIENFLYASFLPDSMESLYSRTARLENRIYLHIDQKKTWQEAYDWCRERSGDLASVGNREIHVFLYKYVVSIGKAQEAFVGGAKIGNNWLWTDGTPFAFTSWAAGQPSGKGGGGVVEDRLTFAWRDGGWNDAPARDRMPFIIQWALY